MFKITQRQYDIIVKQAQANYPKEAGGFFGGRDGLILALLPVPNMHMYSQTETFGLSSDDISRAHRFYQKHSLVLYGFYHSHPKGIAYPSQQDLNTGFKHHLIVGFTAEQEPLLNCFESINRQAKQIELEIITDKSFQVIDIHAPTTGTVLVTDDLPKTLTSEADELQDMIENIKKRQPTYKKHKPKLRDTSSFTTSA